MRWDDLVKNHRPIKALLTLALVVWILRTGLNSQVYSGAMGPFFSFMLASFVVIHLRLRPQWVDAGWIVLIAVLLAAMDFHLFHYPPGVMPFVSLSGLSSFGIIGIRSIWNRERKLLLYAWAPAAIYVVTNPLIDRMHEWTFRLHPKTLDLFLLSFDSSLHVQLAFLFGQYYARIAWFHVSARLAYEAVVIPMALVYAGRLVRFKEGAFPSCLAFLLAGPVGFLFYNLYPACGLVFRQAFPFHPLSIATVSRLSLVAAAFPGRRNAMPSLHLTWTLLAWWYSKGLSPTERLVAFAFLGLNVLATLGTGEHWFADLVVAFPYALMIQAACAYPVPWGDQVRKTALFLGLGATLGWVAMLRYATALFWTSPIVPWTLAAGTIALVLIQQARLNGLERRPAHL